MNSPVSVIIASFNTKDFTRKAIAALLRSDAKPEQIIVVDNASTDGSVGMIKGEFPNVTVIENKENVGFGMANNQGIVLATQPYIWFLNSDTETGVKTLGQLVSYMDAHPEIGAVGPQLVYPDGSLQSAGGFFPTPMNVFLQFIPLHKLLPKATIRQMHLIGMAPRHIPEVGLAVDYATGAALLIRRNLLDSVGGFSDKYFMYFEETDLCYRVCKSGSGIRVINTEPVMHVHGGSFKKKSDIKRLNAFTDGMEIFVRSNYSGMKKIIILAEIALLARLGLVIKRLFGKI